MTVHGFRSFPRLGDRSRAGRYATAERCLAHAVGSDAALSYDRSDRLELRPVMTAGRIRLPAAARNVITLHAHEHA